MEWIRPGTQFDFVGQRRRWYTFSSVLCALSLLLFFGGQAVETPFSPKFGVDFTGGTEIHLKVREGIALAQVRDGLAGLGLNSANVQSFGTSGSEYLIRIEQVSFGAEEFFGKVKTTLTESFGEAAWKGFSWDLSQGMTMTARPTEPRSPSEVRERLVGLHPDVAVVPSAVEAGALDIPYPGLVDAISRQLEGALGKSTDGTPTFEVLGVDSVGPSVGAELRAKGVTAIVLSLVLILAYVAFRFDLAFAPGAIVALFHDCLITVGVMCVFGREFSGQTIAVLLTIIGYSINDTIVVYDRIRENMRRTPEGDLGEIINVSVNETLSRSVLTSFVTLLAVVAMAVFGGPVLRDFSVALFVGFVAGAYSTIFIASPITLFLQRWVPVQMGTVAAVNTDDDPNAGAVV